jgi:hypothetical protein
VEQAERESEQDKLIALEDQKVVAQQREAQEQNKGKQATKP